MLGIVLSLPLALLPFSAQEGARPPGLVLVKGGRTKIGTPADAAAKMVEEREGLRDFLAAETPLFTQEVEDFYLMPTEVTNEQYLAFVEATGAKPPRSWGEEDLRAGQAKFVAEDGLAYKQAREQGKPYERKIFDAQAWWNQNWQQASWKVPEADRTKPVVFVNYGEALKYARWAGLRLMSEFEYQRAARGNSDRTYPWGDSWEEGKCLSLSNSKSAPVAVGSFPEGAVDGIFDLVGNVWEWTSTPYGPYPGYEPLRVKLKGPPKREVQGLAPFDPNQRVVVGGSFTMEPVGLRIAIRKNSDRTQSTDALGFRCAATPAPGLDMASWMLENELKLSALPRDTELAPRFTTCLRRWTSAPGTSKVEDYAVITRYEQLLLCPVKEVKASSPTDLGKQTESDGPFFLGFIDFPFPPMAPQIDAGTYFVAWRAAGDLPDVDPTVEHPWQETPGLVADQDCFFLFARDGRPALAFPAPHAVTSERMRSGKITVDPWVPPDPKTLPKDAPAPTPHDVLHFEFAVQSARTASKGFFFDLALKVPPGTYDSSWK